MPRYVDVVAEFDQDIPEVFSLPRAGPRSNSTLADGELWVWDERVLTDRVRCAEAMAHRASAGDGVG